MKIFPEDFLFQLYSGKYVACLYKLLSFNNKMNCEGRTQNHEATPRYTLVNREKIFALVSEENGIYLYTLRYVRNNSFYLTLHMTIHPQNQFAVERLWGGFSFNISRNRHPHSTIIQSLTYRRMELPRTIFLIVRIHLAVIRRPQMLYYRL